MEKPKVKEILKEFDEWLHTEIHSVTVDGVTRPATDSDRVDFIIGCWEQASDELYKLGILSDHLDELENEKEIERTAQEVPVQEQYVAYINLDENFTKEVIEKISELNKLLNQGPKVTTSQKI